MSDFKDWWALNKEAQNAKRREKYRTDPQTRQRARSSALRRYRTTQRRETQIDRRTVVTEDGTRYISIGRMSRLIGRTVMSIRRYHRMGIIPDPLYCDARGWRLYTITQAALLRRVFRRFEDRNDLGVKNLRDVARLVGAEWGDEGGTDGEGG